MSCIRRAPGSQKQLIDLLYGDDSDSVNPENALRITMHRMRNVLDGLWPGAGKALITYKEGGYCWNGTGMELDVDRFDALIAASEERLPRLLEALGLYQGEFLPRHAGENWVIPISAHYHNRFVEVTLEAARLLMAQQRHSEAAALCRRATEAEPYHEPLYQLLLQALGALGDTKGAAGCYETLRKRLFDDFGIHPNEETRRIYRLAAHCPEDRILPMDQVLSDLREPDSKFGAMVCDYDYFKFLCYTESRTMERSGHATHVALLHLTGSTEVPLSKRSQNRIVEQFGEHIRLNLRRGDVIARCSASQYIIMLPRANYENSCMVCRRVIAAFHHAHPKTAVKIQYMVQPLSPGISVP